MKIKTVRCIIYGAFITGALIMISAAVLPILSDHMTVFMFIGGTIGFSGMLFCLVSLRFNLCPGCREFMIIKESLQTCCPCCNKSLN